MTRISSSKSKKTRVFNELVTILGEENVSENPAVRSAYRGGNYNSITPWGKGPDIVVMPKTVGHVQEVVKLANREKITILPICCGSNTPSFDADIVMDMMGMDKIIKIDTQNSYVLLEPGVTIGRLNPLLRKENYTIPYGSFPPSFSIVANLGVRQGFNHNFSSRLANQVLGFEIVMLDGTLLKTGTATFGSDYWSALHSHMPDLRGFFQASLQQTPLLGIVTKAALRIWPMMEARGLPIGGFDTFAKAIRFCKAVANAGIADQSMVWNWVLVGMDESRANGGKDDIDFLNYRMTVDYTKPYKGLHYCYTWTQFRGYKEQVDMNLKLCEKIAKEFGGKVLIDEELQNTIPHVWESWKLSYRDLSMEKAKAHHLWKVGGEGTIDLLYYVGWIEDLIKLEDAFNRQLKEKYSRLPHPYYCRIFESGIGGHLRYQLPADAGDEYQAKKHIKIKGELHAWVLDNFPNIYASRGPQTVKTHSIGLGSALDKIRDALDPNHIGYMPGDKRLEPEEESEVAGVG